MVATLIGKRLRRAGARARRTVSQSASLQETLSGARCFAAPESDTNMLPLRVCIQGELDREVEALQTAQSRFRQRLERDPERADKWVSAHARRLELEAASDITTHFEQVTGHSLADLDRDSSRHHTSSPSVRGVAPAGLDEASRRAADRYPIKRARSGSLVLATVMAVFVLTMGSYESDPLQGLTGSAAFRVHLVRKSGRADSRSHGLGIGTTTCRSAAGVGSHKCGAHFSTRFSYGLRPYVTAFGSRAPGARDSRGPCARARSL